MRFVHPYSHKKCTIKRTQVPIIPAFSMTAHKAQGRTLDHVIVNLQSCRGTEAPYVMVSRVTSLSGLLILRPFEKKIQSRQSEDARREAQCLEILRLKTIMHIGSPEESADAQRQLSNTRFRDHIGQDEETTDENTRHANPSKRLQRLQTENLRLTDTNMYTEAPSTSREIANESQRPCIIKQHLTNLVTGRNDEPMDIDSEVIVSTLRPRILKRRSPEPKEPDI